MPDFPFNLGDVLGVIPGIGGGLERIYDVVAGGGRGSIPGGAVGQGACRRIKMAVGKRERERSSHPQRHVSTALRPSDV